MRSDRLLCSERLGLGASAAVLLLAGALTGCASTPQAGEMATASNSNIPNAPSIDRSKCSDKGKEIITADTNLDKKPDVWKFFQPTIQNGQKVQVLTCKQVDLNHDGKLDAIYYYDDRGAQTTLEEFDLDFDGKFDMTVYYVNGKRVREEIDSNFDQKPDIFKYYEDDKLVREELDTNFDGKIDQWQYFEAGKLDRIGYDTQGTGKIDKWDRAPEQDENAPPPEQGDKPADKAAPAPAKGATAPPAATTPPAATAPPPAAAKPPAKK
jgi:antitoxin component YwqK of YwqJK toxin-antitoxin module